jgi:MYXO-CTERM domain-containing protein
VRAARVTSRGDSVKLVQAILMMRSRTSLPAAAAITWVALSGGCTPDAAPRSTSVVRSPLTIVPTVDGVDTPVIGAAFAPSAAAAAWDGARFWLTWNDSRTTDTHVAATRVDTDGIVVDRDNLLPPQPAETGYDPAIACSDTVCLVAWRATPGVTLMHGARFDRAGTLLDATPRSLSPSGSSSTDFLTPTMAFDGSVFVIAWVQQSGSTTSYVNAVRVTPAGVVMDTTPKHLVTATVSPALANPVLIHDGTDLVLAWSEGSTRVLVSRVAADLTLRDAPPVAVSTPGVLAFTPVLASDGGGFLIAWGEGDATAGRAVRAQRYAADMTASAPAVTVDPAQTTVISYMAAAFDGARFTVGWARSGSEWDLFIARLDGTAAVVGGVQPFAPGPGSQYGLMLWGSSGRTLVTWSDTGGMYAQVLGADGAPIAPATRAALALNKEQRPAATWNGGGFTVAWNDTRESPIQVYGAVLDQNAAPVRATAFPISQTGTSTSVPVVGSDGTNSLVVWTAGSTSPAPTLGRRFDRNGTPVGGEIVLATTASFTARGIAFGGGVYLVVGDTFTSPAVSYGVRVAPNGTVLDAAPFVLASGQDYPAVASDGSNFLVVFRTLSKTIPAIRVGANGQLLDPALLDVYPAGANPSGTPSVAFGGGVYLVAWDDISLYEIGGVRVGTDGTRLDANVLKLTADTNLEVENNPVVAFNGDVFVLSWRNTIFNSSSQIIGGAHKFTTVTTAGVPGTMGTVASLESSDSLLYPVGVAGGGGRALIAYQILDRAPPYAIDRVKVKYLAPAAVPIGGRCALNMGCASGTCVDGICCETACAGGASDCQACNIIAGAAQNGTCAMLAAGAACATAGMCSAAGVCVSPPADAGADAARDGATTADSGTADVATDRPADAGTVADASADSGRDAGGDGGAPMDATTMTDAPTTVDATASDRSVADAPPAADAAPDAVTTIDSSVPADAAAPTGDAGKPVGGGNSGCGCATAPAARDAAGLSAALVLLLAFARRRRIVRRP